MAQHHHERIRNAIGRRAPAAIALAILAGTFLPVAARAGNPPPPPPPDTCPAGTVCPDSWMYDN